MLEHAGENMSMAHWFWYCSCRIEFAMRSDPRSDADWIHSNWNRVDRTTLGLDELVVSAMLLVFTTGVMLASVAPPMASG